MIGGELVVLSGRLHYARRPCLMAGEERSRAFWSTTGIIRSRMDLVGEGKDSFANVLYIS